MTAELSRNNSGCAIRVDIPFNISPLSQTQNLSPLPTLPLKWFFCLFFPYLHFSPPLCCPCVDFPPSQFLALCSSLPLVAEGRDQCQGASDHGSVNCNRGWRVAGWDSCTGKTLVGLPTFLLHPCLCVCVCASVSSHCRGEEMLPTHWAVKVWIHVEHWEQLEELMGLHTQRSAQPVRKYS